MVFSDFFGIRLGPGTHFAWCIVSTEKPLFAFAAMRAHSYGGPIFLLTGRLPVTLQNRQIICPKVTYAHLQYFFQGIQANILTL